MMSMRGFFTTMLAIESPYTIGELESLLMAQEERFNKKKKVQEPLFDVVQSGEKKNQYQASRQQNFTPRGSGNGGFNGGGNNARGGSNGHDIGCGGRNSGNTKNKLVCQLCGKTGHMA